MYIYILSITAGHTCGITYCISHIAPFEQCCADAKVLLIGITCIGHEIYKTYDNNNCLRYDFELQTTLPSNA